MKLLLLSLAALALLACIQNDDEAPKKKEAKTLKEAFKGKMTIGVAVNTALLGDSTYTSFIAKQFQSVTAENCMKPSSMLRAPGVYDFAETDRFIAFAEANGIEVVGHTLVWHAQSPSFLYADANGQPLPREQALANMKAHIQAVVGRYKGRVKGWDVVNEAVSDSGGMRQTPAYKAIGEDYILKAFQFAAEADPEAELYYNDYNIELDYKRPSALELVKKLREGGAKVDAVGVQGHYLLTSSLDEVKRGIGEFLDAGFKVHVTELDVDVLPRRGRGGADLSASEREGLNPYVNGLPEDKAKEQAEFYGKLFEYFLSEPGVTRVTFWGVHDGHSWLNGFPVRGRTNHALLFDRSYSPKPAFFRVIEAAQGK